MLRHLHIQNYALISRLDIDFEEGFSVLTGETGAYHPRCSRFGAGSTGG